MNDIAKIFGKPNSLSRGPVARLLCVVGEDYTSTLEDFTW